MRAATGAVCRHHDGRPKAAVASLGRAETLFGGLVAEAILEALDAGVNFHRARFLDISVNSAGLPHTALATESSVQHNHTKGEKP